MEIKRIGKYASVDSKGYLLNASDLEANQAHWLEVVDEVKRMYLSRWQAYIASIYIRGSIAKGLAIDKVSDVDSFAVLKAEYPNALAFTSDDEFETWEIDCEQKLVAQYPFVTGLELSLEGSKRILDRTSPYGYIIKTQSVCIYGESLSAYIQPYKIHPDIAFQSKGIHLYYQRFLDVYPTKPKDEQRLWIAWLMRRYLRTGMELVMQEEQKVTNDLYLCYESFIKYYPRQEKRMRQALELAINPHIDEASWRFIESFGDWLIKETATKLSTWGYTQDSEGHWQLG